MLLQLLGKTFEVAESKLEAYAILSAMLPTYFWFQWEELTNLGEPMGLTAKETSETIKQTMLAAINLYFESGLSSKQVIDLIPVKPIGEQQQQIADIYQSKLMGLFEKIKP
jgi:pyrroline-5-carboxylate reductase